MHYAHQLNCSIVSVVFARKYVLNLNTRKLETSTCIYAEDTSLSSWKLGLRLNSTQFRLNISGGGTDTSGIDTLNIYFAACIAKYFEFLTWTWPHVSAVHDQQTHRFPWRRRVRRTCFFKILDRKPIQPKPNTIEKPVQNTSNDTNGRHKNTARSTNQTSQFWSLIDDQKWLIKYKYYWANTISQI